MYLHRPAQEELEPQKVPAFKYGSVQIASQLSMAIPFQTGPTYLEITGTLIKQDLIDQPSSQIKSMAIR